MNIRKITATLLPAVAILCLMAACTPKNQEENDSPRTILIGGDISELSYVEQNGGKYYLDDKVLDRYPDKTMVVMETGYAWNPTLPSGWPGQLKDNGPYPDMTKEGQKAFMKELIDGIRSDGRILGFLYWDPIFIEVPGLGWELGAENVVSNTTLFDFQGNALPVFDAFAPAAELSVEAVKGLH